MYSLKTISILAMAATSAFAAPTPAENSNALEAREPWRSGYRYWTRPSDPEVITVTYSSEPAETVAPSTGSTQSVSSGGDWFSIANKWRVASGKPAFVESAQLVGNAQKTADASVGGLTHQLNPGTFAQVLAPGDASNFESVYVGGWLCELPSTPGLNGICASASGGWDHAGQTGHAEILNGDYKNIGCALSSSTGVWACDLS